MIKLEFETIYMETNDLFNCFNYARKMEHCLDWESIILWTESFNDENYGKILEHRFHP